MLNSFKENINDSIMTTKELDAIRYLELQEEYERQFESFSHLLMETKQEHKQKSFFAKIFDKTGKRGIEYYEKALKNLETERPIYPDGLDKTKAIQIRSDVLNRKSELKSAGNLKEIVDATGLDIRTLLERDDFYLTENDKEENQRNTKEYNDGKQYTSLDELVMVHKTRYLPNEDKIINSRNSNVTSTNSFVLSKETLGYKMKSFRNTVHFCLNGEVGNHSMGNWSNLKYAVVQPITENISNKIASMVPVDTYIDGNVTLDGAYILCPIKEKEEAKKRNPNSTIVGYEGNSVDHYADLLVTLLGYQNEKAGAWSWVNTRGNERISSVIEKHGYRENYHTYSPEEERDDTLERKYAVDQIMKVIREKVTNGEISIMEAYEESENIFERFNVSSLMNKGFHDSLNEKADPNNEISVQTAVQISLENAGVVDSSSKVYQMWKHILTEDMTILAEENGSLRSYDILNHSIISKILFVKNLLQDDMQGLDVDAFASDALEYIKSNQERREVLLNDDSSKAI